MQVTTINGQPTLLIDRPLTADTTPPAAVTNGMTTITTTSPAPGMRHDAIPLAAIASWRPLLGTSADGETVAAILHVRDHGEPDSDPDTGRNAWTSAYEQLEHDALVDLNQVRAAALHRAFKADGALAADGRAETRRLLGLDATTIVDSYEADAALAAARALDEPNAGEPVEPSIRLPAGVDATSLATLLSEHATELAQARTRFLNDITPTITDRR